MFWKPTLALISDVATLLVSVSNGLQGYKCDPQWLDELRQIDLQKEAANRSHNFLHCVPIKSIPLEQQQQQMSIR